MWLSRCFPHFSSIKQFLSFFKLAVTGRFPLLKSFGQPDNIPLIYRVLI